MNVAFRIMDNNYPVDGIKSNKKTFSPAPKGPYAGNAAS
jgi:hypothetical protein